MNSHRRRGRARLALVLVALIAVVAPVAGLTAWNASFGAGGSVVEVTETAASSAESTSFDWPAQGAAAVAIGDGPIATSSDAPLPMASISKVVTSLMVLDAVPLGPGEQGPIHRISWEHERQYEDAVRAGKSALRVPVGGRLSQYELLEGILIGSACNYADILVDRIWGSEAAFADAAASFLASRGIVGVTMVEPTGFDAGNTATPSALIQIGRLALQNPVIAEIVAKTSVDLPGAGHVENTNDLLAEPGALGIKTGTLGSHYNLLSARALSTPDGTTTPVFVVVMGQPDDDTRYSASRALYDQAFAIAGR